MIKKFEEIYLKRREMVDYLIAGGAATAVNWFVYVACVRFAGLSVTAGNVAAWVMAVAFAFYINKVWVFKSGSWEPKTLVREAAAFFGARAVTGIIEIIGVPLLVRTVLSHALFGIEGFTAKIIVSVFVIVSNYFFSKKIIFKPAK